MRSLELASTKFQPSVIDAPQPMVAPSPTTCDKVSRVVFILIVGLMMCCSLASVVGGGLLHRSIAGLPFANCLIFESIGVAAITVGVVALVIGIAIVSLLIVRNPTVGMIFADSSHPAWKALRFLGWFVTPFVAAVVLVALSIASIVLYTLSLQVPSITENYSSVPGLTATVTIARDSNGLVHINASTVEDAIFGQGFAQAQDRLWQLEFQRLAAQGRLAEFVGSAALDVDKQVRTLNFNGAAQLMCSSLTPNETAKLQAFASGINYYLSHVKERPPEFMFMSERLLFFHEPAPFVPMDVCLTAKLLQWQLSLNVQLEVERFNIFWRTNRTYDQIEELFTNQTNISHTILNAEQMGFSEADAQASRQREYADYLVEKSLYATYMTGLRGATNLPPQAERHRPSSATKLKFDVLRMKQLHASNAWAARAAGDGSQPAQGASDPHLKINLPSVWYYTHMTARINASLTMDYSGVGMTGIPGCQIGKNNFVSWGITMSLTDLEDLYLMVPDASRPSTHYMYNGVSTPYTFRTESIKVKGESDLILRVRESILGPEVTEIFDDLPRGLAFCVSAVALQPDMSSVTGIVNLLSPEMTTVKALRDTGLGLLQSPGFSITAADRDGNVGYFMTAAHPIRAIGHTGKYPTLGNGSFAYVGTIPYSELPTLIIPASSSNTAPSFIAAANQKIYPDGYRYTLGYDYVYPWRGARIQEMLGADLGNLSSGALHKKIQRDTQSNIWTEFRQVLQNTTAGTVGDLFSAALTPQGAAWLQRLLLWSGRSSMGSVEPSFFFLWLRSLTVVPQDVIEAAISANSNAERYYPADRPYVMNLFFNPTPMMTAQCGQLTDPKGGSCVLFAAQQFNQLAAADPKQKWGVDINRLTGEHLMMHKTILACLFERTINKDGDFSTIDVSDFGSKQEEMAPDAASSMRQLYDWSAPGTVAFSLPAGESGNPYSRFYQNLFSIFSDDGYVNVTVLGLPDSVAASQQLSP